jgi:hypothetical protein
VGVRDELLKTKLVSQEQLKGCSRQEVADLADSVGGRLPKAYEDFLLSMGHGAGKFLAGTDTFWPVLPLLRDAANRLLEESSAEPLTPSAFVLYMHQGYEFGYFLLDDGDDPAVYQYAEGWPAPQQVWGSFTDYMAEMLEHFSHAHSSRYVGR